MNTLRVAVILLFLAASAFAADKLKTTLNPFTGKLDFVQDLTGYGKACVDVFDGAPGATGPAGPANSLAVGTVTTLDPAQQAFVNISGIAPNQTISFGIPQGQQGQNAMVTQEAVLGVLDDPGGSAIDRQPLAPQTNNTSMYQVRDLSGNVTWFRASSGEKFITSAGTIVTEIKQNGEILSFDTTGKLAFRIYSSGNQAQYNANGLMTTRRDRAGGERQYDRTGKLKFERYSSGAIAL